MNVAELILSRGPDSALAILQGETMVSYSGLRDGVARFASYLLSRGRHKGDRVGVLAENSPFFVKAYLGIIRAGLVAVPLQTDLTAEAFARIISEADIKEVFVSNHLRNRARSWAGPLGLTLLAENQEKNFLNSPISPPAIVNEASDLASLMFTSGSTGAPKGVMVTHRNIECNSRDIIAYLN